MLFIRARASAALGGGADAKPVAGQIALQQGAQPLIVIHHQQMRVVERGFARAMPMDVPVVMAAIPAPAKMHVRLLRFSRPPCCNT